MVYEVIFYGFLVLFVMELSLSFSYTVRGIFGDKAKSKVRYSISKASIVSGMLRLSVIGLAWSAISAFLWAIDKYHVAVKADGELHTIVGIGCLVSMVLLVAAMIISQFVGKVVMKQMLTGEEMEFYENDGKEGLAKIKKALHIK